MERGRLHPPLWRLLAPLPTESGDFRPASAHPWAAARGATMPTPVLNRVVEQVPPEKGPRELLHREPPGNSPLVLSCPFQSGACKGLHCQQEGSGGFLWSRAVVVPTHAPFPLRTGGRTVASGNDPLGKRRRRVLAAHPPGRSPTVPPGPAQSTAPATTADPGGRKGQCQRWGEGEAVGEGGETIGLMSIRHMGVGQGAA